MSAVEHRVREYGTVEGVHSGTLEEVMAAWRDGVSRMMQETTAKEFRCDVSFPQINSAMLRANSIRAVRM